MKNLKIANYPVGLAVSPDDKYIAVTQQGKSGNGGNMLMFLLGINKEFYGYSWKFSHKIISCSQYKKMVCFLFF